MKSPPISSSQVLLSWLGLLDAQMNHSPQTNLQEELASDLAQEGQRMSAFQGSSLSLQPRTRPRDFHRGLMSQLRSASIKCLANLRSGSKFRSPSTTLDREPWFGGSNSFKSAGCGFAHQEAVSKLTTAPAEMEVLGLRVTSSVRRHSLL
jgi:hypothetical protein